MSHGIVVKGTYQKREDEKNKLRMGGGSWTINLDEIENKNFTMIKYITPQANYLISLDRALLKGFERVLGGERKLVVPVEYWQVIKRRIV